MKHLVSMINFYPPKDPEYILKWTAENGFSGIELWADPPYFYVDTADEKLLKKFGTEESGLEYTVHAPFYNVSIASVNPGIHRESIRQIEKIIGWKDFMNVKNILLHMGKTPSVMDSVMKEVGAVVRSALSYLKDKAGSSGVDIIVENIGVGADDYDRRIENFIDIVKELDLKVCIDTGHANLSWGTRKTIEELKERTVQLHISDNDGISDLHLPAGEGTVEWNSYVELLKLDDIYAVHEIKDAHDPEGATLRSRDFIERAVNNVSRETS